MGADAVLEQVHRADLLRFTTAGSVDDGKSTLIGRLLHDAKSICEDQLAAVQQASRRNGSETVDFALLTDGLKAEREQRITIDVAYRHFSTPRRRFIIADTPGHEQYTRNMVTGASTADLAVILVDAEAGITVQTRRHGFIASLLGIPHVVLAVNKMDRVGYAEAVFRRIAAEYAAFAAGLRTRDITPIPVSALLGDNIVAHGPNMPWYDGPSLLTHLEEVPVAGDRNLRDLRLPVQVVLRPDADFRGYGGTVASGVLRRGDEVVILPSGRKSRVTRIVGPNGDLDAAAPPQAVTVCLEHDEDVSRGDMLAHPGNLPWLSREPEAILIWMSEDRLQPDKTYVIKHTTRTVRGTCARVHFRVNPGTLEHEPADDLGLNEIGRVRMKLLQPLLCDEYDLNRRTGRFIVIDPDTNNTVAGGLIVDRADLGTGPSGGPPVPANVTRHRGSVSAADRARLLRQKPVTLWLTGLSGSGKSTLAYELERHLIAAGHPLIVLDGDNLRHGLNRDLGFSAEDRAENIRRVAEVARLFNDAGLLVIASFISPYRVDRENARAIIGAERFLEGHVDAPLAECERRDPKGLYAKARAGAIPSFTGISAPYEAPTDPDLHLRTDCLTVEELARTVLQALAARDFLPAQEPAGYTGPVTETEPC